MLLRVKVSTLLGLEELRSNSHGRAVPPQAAEDICRSSGLSKPARRRYVRAACCELEASLPFERDRLVALEAKRSGLARLVPVPTIRCVRQSGYCIPKRSPGDRGASEAELLRMGWHGPLWPARPAPDRDGAFSCLRDPIVSGVQDAPLDYVPELVRSGNEQLVLRGPEKLGNVLHDK